jgi:hypothetical protein
VKPYEQRKSYRPGRDLRRLVLEGISDRAAQMRAFFGVVAVPKSTQSLRSLHFLFSCVQLSAGVERHLFVALIVDIWRASEGKRQT